MSSGRQAESQCCLQADKQNRSAVSRQTSRIAVMSSGRQAESSAVFRQTSRIAVLSSGRQAESQCCLQADKQNPSAVFRQTSRIPVLSSGRQAESQCSSTEAYRQIPSGMILRHRRIRSAGRSQSFRLTLCMSLDHVPCNTPYQCLEVCPQHKIDRYQPVCLSLSPRQAAPRERQHPHLI